MNQGMKRGLTRYGDEEFSLFLRKAFIKAMGYSDDALGRPVVGIVNTYSGFNACHRNVPDLIRAIERGVMHAGGLAVDFPVISLHESFAYPTSMFLRNLMAIDTEEMIRASPLDAVVLIGGCDKTVPALLMGAGSAGVPAIMEVTGPMLAGSFRGERIGACTDCRRLWGKFRAGEISEQEIDGAGAELVPGPGTCGVMGTASTMALMTEALGMMLPGGAAIPAVHADRLRHAEATGARAVALAEAQLKPADVMTPQAFHNALVVLQAIGGSTNALIHITAVARRLGIDVDLEAFDQLGRHIPVLADVRPSGQYYMEDLHRAGGLTPIMRELDKFLVKDCMTINGSSLGENLAAQPQGWSQQVVHSIEQPFIDSGGMAVLRGNLAPSGAIIKHAAASDELMQHEGRAVVFDSIDDLMQRIDSADLDVEASDVLVLRNAGPKGAPGMPESGYIPIPKKLAMAGVKDMVRISDARMSGTAFGTIVLHVSPESAAGGPLALVESGDRIALDVEARTLELKVSADVLNQRRASITGWQPAHAGADRGYLKLFLDTVEQAERGCDFDFLGATEITAQTPLALPLS